MSVSISNLEEAVVRWSASLEREGFDTTAYRHSSGQGGYYQGQPSHMRISIRKPDIGLNLKLKFWANGYGSPNGRHEIGGWGVTWSEMKLAAQLQLEKAVRAKSGPSAEDLIEQGYCLVSRKHRLVSRVDKKDWLQKLAKHHAPWDPKGEGREHVMNMGLAQAADFYRRVLSNEKKQVSPELASKIPGSLDAAFGWCKDGDVQGRSAWDKFCEETVHYLGYIAKLDGNQKDDNPYDLGTLEHIHWNKGWDYQPVESAKPAKAPALAKRAVNPLALAMGI